MIDARHTNVRVIRTQSLERKKTGSIKRKRSTEKPNSANSQNQREKSLVNVSLRQDTAPKSSSSKSRIDAQPVRVIRLKSTASEQSTTSNTHNISLGSSDLTECTKKDSISKRSDHVRNVTPAFSNPVLSTDNNEIDTSMITDRFQVKKINDLLPRSKYTPSNPATRQMSPRILLPSLETTNPKQYKRRRAGGFFRSPICLSACVLITLLLLSAVIAALTVGLLSINKTVTTTTDTTMTTTSSPAAMSNSSSTTANNNSSSTTSASSSTTINTNSSTTTDTSSSTTTSTSTASTTTSTTTSTRPTCGTSCLNQTWIDYSLLHAEYKFENNFLDETKQYNGTGFNNPLFVAGYSGQAVSFAFNASQMVSTSYIPLGNKSYSIDAWIYPTALFNVPHHSICGICASPTTDLCFHTTLRYTSTNYYLYHGFYGDDTNSNAKPMLINEWVHVAFTFDVTKRIQTVYHNGILLRNNTVNSPFLGMTGDFQIGMIPNLTKTNISNMFQGYIDELSVSGRVKSSCEILEQAILAVRFSFDNAQPLLDQGPNSVSTNGSNYVIVNGRSLNAISFINSSPSYLQASGFLALGLANQPFSISLWIKPVSLAGTLVHISNNSLGSGFCTTYLGFASNGSFIAQVLTSTGYIGISYSNLSLITFSHVVQTWSSTNGLRLYIDNVLIATKTASNTLTSLVWTNYVTIGSCLNGCGTCNSGQVSPGQFVGAVDDFRIYTRELTSDDVCAVYASGFS